MSYGTTSTNVHKKRKLDKRTNNENWYARLTLDNGFVARMGVRLELPLPQTDSAYRLCWGYANSGEAVQGLPADLDCDERKTLLKKNNVSCLKDRDRL